MPKINIAARTDKVDQNGQMPLRLRVSYASVRRYLQLGLRLKKKHWNARKQEVRKSHPQSARLNAHLSEIQSTAQSAVLDLKMSDTILTADRARDAIEAALSKDEDEHDEDFIQYAWRVIEDYRRRDKIATYKRLSATIRKLEAYQEQRCGKAVLSFHDLTPSFLRRYRTHLVEHHGNAPNTVAKELKGLRMILYTAIREGRFPQDQNPFFHITIREKRVKKDKLTREEVERIEALDLETQTSVWHARNYFLFSLYMAGIRFTDFCTLRQKNVRNAGGERRLFYQMSKTDKEHNLLLLPPAGRILERYAERQERGPETYLFPLLDGEDGLSDRETLVDAISRKGVLVNRHLKTIQEAAGIDTTISFHIARHSFADIARKKGWSIYDISKALGHSSIEVTERYLKDFDQAALDEEMRALF